MKMFLNKIWFPGLVVIGSTFQSCIYEYPHVSPLTPGHGNDPTTVEALIEVSFDINWESMLHNVEFETNTKAATDRPHRFIIEVADDDKTLCHDIKYISSDEFSNGKLRHSLSVPLEARNYHITAWYDLQDTNGDHAFSADNLSNVTLTNFSSTDADIMQCAFAHDTLDLRNYDTSKESSVSKELHMSHAGAKFEIYATDVEQFILDNKQALNQGDKFSAHISFSYGASTSFNSYTEDVNLGDPVFTLSGQFRLPFVEYDQFPPIAQGFIFCRTKDEVIAKIKITNSALSTISQTPEFSFPVKRGYLTKVTGDFLTNSIDGLFTVDNIWDGEIEIEI